MALSTKKKSHAGRKPAGPFSNNTSQLTIRMPDDLRDEVQRAADKKGWSLTQELLWRVRLSYRKERQEERRPPATRALCFLISELAERAGFLDISKWHRSAFAFHAFRLAVGQLLESLQPKADPLKGLREAFHETPTGEAIRASMKTPEAYGAHIAKGLVDELLQPRSAKWETDYKDMLRTHPDPQIKAVAEGMLDTLYGMSDARRDLGIQP
jgi:hypothetical protein